MPDDSPLRRQRTCTDIPCLILIIGVLIGWIVVAVLAAQVGSINRLIKPSDMYGEICGVGKQEKKPYLFFFDLSQCSGSGVSIYGCETPQICVEKCPPKAFWGKPPHTKKGGSLSFATETLLKKRIDPTYCLENVGTNTSMRYEDLVDGYHCPSWYPASGPLGGRCLPLSVVNSVKKMSNLSKDLQRDTHQMEERMVLQARSAVPELALNGTGNSTAPRSNSTTSHTGPAEGNPIVAPQNVTDYDGKVVGSDGSAISERMLRKVKRVLASLRFVEDHYKLLVFLSVLFPLLLSMLYIGLLRWFIKPVVWISVICAVLVFVGLSIYCGIRFSRLQKGEDHTVDEDEEDEKYDKRAHKRKVLILKILWMLGCIVAAIVALVLTIIIIALRKKIMLAIAMLKQVSIAMTDMISILLLPLINFILQLIMMTIFLFVLLTLYGAIHKWMVVGDCSCDIYKTNSSCFPSDFEKHCGKKCPQAECTAQENLGLYIYDVLAFIWAIEFIDALAQIAIAMCFSTWYFGHRAHTIPLATPLRSLGIAALYHTGTAAFGSLLIVICKVLRWLLEKVRKEVADAGGWLADCAMSCCICCCQCLENCLEFINRRAYIVTALEGTGLCAGAKKGLDVVARNATTVIVADSVASMVIWLARLVVIVASVLLVHVCIPTTAEQLLVKILFSLFVAWIIAASVFTVYDIGVDTIVFCVMVDLEMNDGSPMRPYRMSSEIATIVGVANAAPEFAGDAPALLTNDGGTYESAPAIKRRPTPGAVDEGGRGGTPEPALPIKRSTV